jgi:hypothetical protein
MRKGLTTTLLTVAIALMGFNAMAAAPVISGIPDTIVVGDAEDITATDPNIFVYPDAINLDTVVSDDATADDQIIWSYTKASLPGRFLLNGVDAINTDPTNAPAGNRLRQVAQGERNPDGQVQTVTVRDNTLSPIATNGGNGPYGSPGAPGKVAGSDEMVTLVASDGTTYSTAIVAMYSLNDGNDSFGGEFPTPTQVTVMSFTASTMGWNSNAQFGSITASRTASGLCLEVPAAGINFGDWHYSNFSLIPLVANQVYRVRMTMTTTAAANQTPLWQFVHENGSGADPSGVPLLAYGGETLFLDNVGSANAPSPITGGRTTFDVYVAPPPVTTTQWNNTTTGPFAAANASSKDARGIFRVLDVENTGYGGETDAGQVCMRDIDIVRWDVNSGVAGDTLLDVTSFTDAGQSGGGPAGAWQFDSVLGVTSVTFTGGVATIAPSGAGWGNVEVVIFRPGDKTANPATGENIADNYPVAWESNTVYHITMNLAGNNDASPPDIMRLGADTPTQEVIGNCYWTTKYALSAMPKSGTPQTYHFFYHSNSKTASPVAAFSFLRPRLDIICRSDFQESTDQGSVAVSTCKVQKVQFE